MPFTITVHYDNSPGFRAPHLWVWYEGSGRAQDLAPAGQDAFGPVYEVAAGRPSFRFKFKDGLGIDGPWEGQRLERTYQPRERRGDDLTPGEIWCSGDKPFVYEVEPRAPEMETAAEFLGQRPFKPGVYVPRSGGLSGLGANLLADGRVQFGLYHPNAARVYLMGSFNDWQRPGHEHPEPEKFIELKRYRGYFGAANTWLAVTDRASLGDEYKFVVLGGVPADAKGRFQRYTTDPYARRLGPHFGFNNAVVLDPTTYSWHDDAWVTPTPDQLIVYELSVHGFTEGDPDIDPGNHGKFKGITERIQEGYFDQLGVNTLALMPLAEVPSPQAPDSLGYDPSLFFTTERDFGDPDDLRELVDTAHQRGLVVVFDQVFNHTSSSFNPLWQLILEHPDEASSGDGGLYFSGTTPWGNRVATEKEDVQNMLIDACRLMLVEYHVDGFRFDATHSSYMDHGFLTRLAAELKADKPNVLLIAENLPNEPDLNLRGFDGFAQWCDPFHDKLKALLREGDFGSQANTPEGLGDIFYFSKGSFASHTNNVVNYCYSHDENSVAAENAHVPWLNNPAAKERKGRLGLFATLAALGQPMLYMGQEFNNEQVRNIVTVEWPADLEAFGFFQWARRLIALRRRYPGLRLFGYDPTGAGQFTWLLGPWLAWNRGGRRRVVGWRARPNEQPHDTLVVMLNFEPYPVEVDVDFGIPGVWVKLADIDRVNDIPPHGSNSAGDPTAIHTRDGSFDGFVLPDSSGFIYKWEAP